MDKYIWSPREIYDYLDEYISGQEEAKKAFSNLGYMYNLRLSALASGVPLHSLPRLNTFLTGKTGGGKTYMVTKLAEALGLPLHRFDMTNFTAQGWHGPDIDEAFKLAMKESIKGHCVVFLDEADKMGYSNSGDGGTGIRDSKLQQQQNILDLLEGWVKDPKVINNALIILGGSFQMSRDAKEEAKSPIGFFGSKEEHTTIAWREFLKEQGLIPELVNRIVNFVELEELTRDQIKDIMLNKKGSAYVKYKNLYQDLAELAFVEIEAIVDEVYTSQNGLRELESLLYKHVNNKLNEGFNERRSHDFENVAIAESSDDYDTTEETPCSS